MLQEVVRGHNGEGWGGSVGQVVAGLLGDNRKGFDLLINGGCSSPLQVLNSNAGHFSNGFLFSRSRILNVSFC